MNLSQYIVKLDGAILDIYKSYNSTWVKFCFVEDNSKIVWVISDWDITRIVIERWNFDFSINDVVNRNFKFLTKMNYKPEDILKIFLEDKILFIPILDEDKKIVDLITEEKFYSNILLQDNIIDDNLNDITPRPWWFYKSIYLSRDTRSKILCVYPKQKLSLQKHLHREEHWIIVNWHWEIILEESSRKLEKWDYFFIPKWTKHRIANNSESENLYFIEVQLWSYFWEDDIIRFHDEYWRIQN